MPTLFVRCRRCASLVPTPIALQEPSHLLVSGLRVTCPRCGTTGDFYTHDLIADPGVLEPTQEPGDRSQPSSPDRSTKRDGRLPAWRQWGWSTLG